MSYVINSYLLTCLYAATLTVECYMQCRCFRWRCCWSAVDGHRQTPQAVCQSQLAHPRSGRAAESSLVAGYDDPPVYSIGSLCCLLMSDLIKIFGQIILSPVLLTLSLTSFS